MYDEARIETAETFFRIVDTITLRGMLAKDPAATGEGEARIIAALLDSVEACHPIGAA